MTKKKKKVSPANRFSSVSFKVEGTVVATQPKSVPVNLVEEKARFLKTGLTPRFEVQDMSKIAELAGKTKNQIRFDLQGEAEHILEYVRDQYGDGEQYLEHAFGSRITKEQATPMVLEYINENSLSESLKIHWCESLACSAKMVWRGPVLNANKPELRKYSLWINWSDENNYMRESGIKCLMDHEIGTHFFRLINDGFQPWFSDRTRFDLRGMGSFEGQCTEEGLASIHTALRARVRLLWSPALAYYTACKAAEMSFKELFDHLGRYTSNIDFRWKQVMRVKRGLADPRDLGGFGNDQCYFEGAVKILRNMDHIDFQLLMSGKICMDEVDRIKRVVRKDVLHFPTFMKNMATYRRTLKKMLVLNGLDRIHDPRGAPAAFTKRLAERKKEGDSPRKSNFKKVRSKPSKALLNYKYKGTSAGKKSSASQKEKDKKIKSKEQMSSPEVEKFPVSNGFINSFNFKKGEMKQKEQEARTARLEQSVRENIASLDCSISERIEQLRSIVREHTWSKSDSGYRDSLISEVSFEALEAEGKIGTDILCKDKVQDRQDAGEDDKEELQNETNKHVVCELVPPTDVSSSFDSDLITSRSITLEDSDQPHQHNMKDNTRRFMAENKQPAKNGLPDVKLVQKHSEEMYRCLQARGGSANARNKLISRKRIVLPMSVSSVMTSMESIDQSGRSELSSRQASGDFEPCCEEIDKLKSNAILGLCGEDVNHMGNEIIQNNLDLSVKSHDGALEKMSINRSATEVFTNKAPWYTRQISNPKTGVRILQRERSGTALNLKPGLASNEKLVGRTLPQPGSLSSTQHKVLSSDNNDSTFVKFRVPKLQVNVSSFKTLPLTDKVKDTKNFLPSQKSLSSKSMVGDRQLARMKLGSLAKDKYSYFVDVSVKQVDNPIVVSQPLVSKHL